jgi:hypothetical protein
MDPSMIYQLLNHPEFSKVDLNNLESVSTGASQLHNGLRDKFEHRANNVPFLTEGIYTLHVGDHNLTDRPPQATACPNAYVSAAHDTHFVSN